MMIRKFIAEFIGTAALVLFGCGTAAVLGCDKGSADTAYIATALAFGLSIVAMAYSIGNVSGCHINPAVSIGMLLSGRMKAGEFIVYIAAQFAGGIAGAAVLMGLIGTENGLGANSLYNGSIAGSLCVEIILTFFFVLTVLGVTSKTDNGKVAGLVIGLTLALIHILGIHFTGTSVNPARSLGPALLLGGGSLGCVWVFIAAPLIGGVLAALVYTALDGRKKD
jgi:aquaporin Z